MDFYGDVTGNGFKLGELNNSRQPDLLRRPCDYGISNEYPCQIKVQLTVWSEINGYNFTTVTIEPLTMLQFHCSCMHG